jgi:hypothetical protein
VNYELSEELEVKRKIVNALWGLMGEFDKFDDIMHRLESIVDGIQPEYIEYILNCFDLHELITQLHRYSYTCYRIASTLERLLEASKE